MAVVLPDCYHPGLTKKECEDLLGKKAKDGAFLLRDSETASGVLCLCVYKRNIVYTYRVLTSAGLYFLPANEGVQEDYFSSLKELISHYRGPDQGLAIQLGSSINRGTLPLSKSRPPPITNESIEENSYGTYVTILPPLEAVQQALPNRYTL